MVEKNSFLGKMMDRKASGNTPDAKVQAESAAGDFYNSTEYTNIKYRLIEQRSQLIKMVDYAEDTSIKLNDIYEIIKNMQLPQTGVERVDTETSTSALDLFFRDNGYIPVKVLNDFQGQGGGFDVDFDRRNRRRRSRFGKKTAIIAGLLAALGIGAAAYALSGSDAEETPEPEAKPKENTIPEVAPDLAPVAPPITTAPDLLPPVIPDTAPVITPGPMGAPITSPTPDLPAPAAIPDTRPSAPIDIPETSAPDLPNPVSGIPMPSNDVLAPIMTALAGVMATLQMLTSRAAGAAPYGMGVRPPSSGFRGGGGRLFTMPYNDLLNVSIDETTEAPTVKKMILEASEITFEADKFDFIHKTLFAPTENAQLTNASYGSSAGGGSAASSGMNVEGGYKGDAGTSTGGSVSGGTATGGSASGGGGYGGGAGDAGAAGSVMGDSAITPGMSGAGGGTTGAPGEVVGIQETGAGYNVVQLADGTVEKRTGARNWRNNNPGNIQYGDFARSQGAIGTDGRFAIFPTFEMGEKAQETLLFESANYKDKTIAQAISRYAPPSENNTGAYVNAVASAVGVTPDTPLSSLSPDQRKIMLSTMHKVEGFRAGNTETLVAGTGLSPSSTSSETASNIGAKPSQPASMLDASGYVAGLSKDVTMGLETPQRPTTGGAVNMVTNINAPANPAYNRVDEPMAAMDDMMKKLFDDVIFT